MDYYTDIIINCSFEGISKEPSYYQEFTNKLNLLIERDVLMDYKSHLSFNIR